MRSAIDDEQPVSGFSVIGIEAQGLAKEDGGGLVLVAARGELADQAIGHAALRIETDDFAQITLGFEIAAQRDMRPGAHESKGHAVGLRV